MALVQVHVVHAIAICTTCGICCTKYLQLVCMYKPTHARLIWTCAIPTNIYVHVGAHRECMYSHMYMHISFGHVQYIHAHGVCTYVLTHVHVHLIWQYLHTYVHVHVNIRRTCTCMYMQVYILWIVLMTYLT